MKFSLSAAFFPAVRFSLPTVQVPASAHSLGGIEAGNEKACVPEPPCPA